jgi:hypothetical protein
MAVDTQATEQEAGAAVGQRQRREFWSAMAIVSALNERSARERWPRERDWAERITLRKQLDSAETLERFLVVEWEYWAGHAPTPDECATITAIARTMWAERLSRQVAP